LEVERKKKVVVPLEPTGSDQKPTIKTGLAEVIQARLAAGGFLAKTFSLLLLEVDDFCGLEKVFGGARIEKLCGEISAILRQNLRNSDVIAGYGKAGYAAVLSSATAEDIADICDRVRGAIKSGAFAPEYGHVLKVTVSIGYVGQEDACQFSDAEDLIRAAAQSLRLAQELGQDRAIRYEPTEAEDLPEAETGE
jgi:diguanylate cyclase (GGDEF)-like protein